MADREQVTKIVTAYAKRNAFSPDQLPALIATVYDAIATVESGRPSEPAKALVPAVSVRRSIRRKSSVSTAGIEQKCLSGTS
jgi:predicted transcriptional regulator